MFEVEGVEKLVTGDPKRERGTGLLLLVTQHLAYEATEGDEVDLPSLWGRDAEVEGVTGSGHPWSLAYSSAAAASCAALRSGEGSRPKKSTPTAATASTNWTPPEARNCVVSFGSSSSIVRTQRK